MTDSGKAPIVGGPDSGDNITMSREYNQFVKSCHQDIARRFADAEDEVTRHVECRVSAGTIYVYLMEGDEHVQTQETDLPDRWHEHWPDDATVRRYIHRVCDIGSRRITTLDA